MSHYHEQHVHVTADGETVPVTFHGISDTKRFRNQEGRRVLRCLWDKDEPRNAAPFFAKLPEGEVREIDLDALAQRLAQQCERLYEEGEQGPIGGHHQLQHLREAVTSAAKRDGQAVAETLLQHGWHGIADIAEEYVAAWQSYMGATSPILFTQDLMDITQAFTRARSVDAPASATGRG